MKGKKVIAYLLLGVMVLENAMTSYAVEGRNTSANTEIISEQEVESEDDVGSSIVESTQTEEASQDKESLDDEMQSETEVSSQPEESSEDIEESESTLSDTVESSESETLSENETITESEKAIEDETITEKETDIEIETETEEETESIAEKKKIENNKSASEDEDIRYILGRPMTDEEIAEQKALVPDYLPTLEVARMGGTDITAGLDSFTTFSDEELPEKFDLREEGIVTPVKDQNPWGTCWSFATMALLESSWKAQHSQTLDLAEHHLAYFVKNTGYDALDNSNDDTIEVTSTNNSYYLNSGGNLLSATTKLMNWHGAALESKYPYPTSTTVPDALNREVAQDREIIASDIYFIPVDKNTAQDEKVTTIKKALQQYGCVEWSYFHDDGSYFYNAYNEQTAAYYFSSSEHGTNHAITVVGWDDTYKKENFLEGHQPTSDGAWIVKNSWSSSWGDKGYFYISYEDKSLGNGNEPGVAKAVMADEYDNNYFYGNITSTVYYINYDYGKEMAQVYQIKGESTQQTIEAVSTMFYKDNQSYSIQLYKNPAMVDGVVQDPSSGTPLLSSPVTGTTGYAGLYTIAIPNVTVNEGDYVSIVISFDGNFGYINSDKSYSNGNIIETNITHAGQSFKKTYSGDAWTDLHNSDTKSSLKINLLTSNLDTTVTKPELTYTVADILDFYDELACNLKWTKCTNVKNYEVYRAEQESGEYTLLATLDADVRSYKDVVGNENMPKTYYYKVVAVSNDGSSDESDVVEVEFEYQLSFEIDSFKQYMDKVVLTWDTVDGATGYTIERKKQGDAQYEKVADIADSDATTYTCDTKELDWAVYEYRMRAYKDESVYTDWSENIQSEASFKLTQNTPIEVYAECNTIEGGYVYLLTWETPNKIKGQGNIGSTNITAAINDEDTGESFVGEELPFYVSVYASQEDYYNNNPMYKSGTIYFYTVPDSPTNLDAIYVDGKANFTWDATTYAEKIHIYRSTDENDRGNTLLAEIDASNTSYEDADIVTNMDYYYWFVPVVVNSEGTQIEGEAVIANVNTNVVEDADPVTLNDIEILSETEMKVSWKAYTGATGYVVYRKAGNTGSYERLSTISDVSQIEYIDNAIVTGKTYYYKVIAEIDGGITNLSSATEKSGQTKPGTPILVATDLNEIKIQSNVDFEYAIGTSKTVATDLEYVSGNGKELSFTDLTDATQYYVFVRTKQSVTGEAAVYAEEPLAVITKQAIDFLVIDAIEISETSAKISWEEYAGADSYVIYRRDKNNDNYTQIAIVNDVSQLEYIDSSLITGKTYYYKVTAFRNGIETDLTKTEEKSVQTKPAQITIADNGISYDSITINSNINYEYAIGLPGQTKETLTYYKATGATYVFSELSPNTRYTLYVRTDESVTGEAAVYGKELTLITSVEARLVLSVKDIVISKGNTVPFTYYIEPSNIHYNDNVEWKATNSEGTLYTIEKIPNEADAIIVKDALGNEILRVSNGVLVATGESQEKKVYLTVSKGAIKADCVVQINVPVTKLDIGVESVNDNTELKEIKELKIGEYAKLNAIVTPANADDTLVKWSSSNQSVASVENGLLTAKGVGSCEIKAYTDDGVYDTLTINVKKAKEISAIWLSDNMQFNVSGVTPTWNEEKGEYTVDGLEANPSYTLDGVNSTKALAVYVLENGKLLKASSGITLKSSDLSIATVSNEGVVTATNAGEADIVAYDNYGNDVYGICHIIVDGEKQNEKIPNEYPLDKGIKLSPVEKTILIEAFANDANSSKTVQIKNQMGHIYTGEELKLFSFTSSNPQACIVDENGEVRPNPNYQGKNASVKITATLKNDIGRRKVTFTVKVLTTKQIDRIEILQVGRTENESIIVQNYESGATLTFKANAYDSKGVEISAPKLKYTLSDTGVATLKTNKDGTATVIWKKSGRTNLICTATDELKNKNQVQLAAVSTQPYISTKQLTVNVKNVSKVYDNVQYKESGSFRINVQNGVNKNNVFIDSIKLGKSTLNAEQSNFKLIENADGSYKIAVRQDYAANVKKNSKFAVNIGVNVTNTLTANVVNEYVSVNLKVTSQEPKITVSEAKTINRYYTNLDETLLILNAANIVTNVEIVDNPSDKNDNYFTVKELYNGQWYLKFNNDSTYNANNTKLNLRLTVAGYEPIIKKLKVQTPCKKQVIKQQSVPTIHYGNGQTMTANIELYNKTAKKAFVGIGEIISFESEKLQLESFTTKNIQVSIKPDKTVVNGETLSALIKMKPDNWQNEMSITVKVKVANKAPKIVTKASSLTLNNKVPKEKAMTAISTDQNNINICNSAMWDIKLYNASTKQYNSTDIFKAEYVADGGVLYVGFADGKVAGKGSYKIRLQNVLEGFENVYKDITIKVIDVEPKISVKTKGKLDLINRSNSTLVGTIKCTNSVSANVTGVKILADNKVDANEIFKAKLLSAANTISISFTDKGIADNQLKKQKYMLPIEITLENSTKLISEMAISLTQAVPKVVVPAQQTIIKSVNSLTRDYDFATKLAKGVEIERIDVISVPNGFSAVAKEGHVLVTLNNRGIKSGKYTFKVNIYFKGAQNATKPVTKNISVKVSE